MASAAQAVQQAMAGLGADLKDGVVLEIFLVQSEISMNKRVDYKSKLKLVVIFFPQVSLQAH